MEFSSKIKKLLWLNLILLVFWLYLPTPVLADIAPPEQPPGGNPAPGMDATQVRMAAETVLIEVISATPAGSLGKAKVTAKFTMLNLGAENESLAVRFPLTSNYGSYYGYKELENFKASVDGVPLQIRKIESNYNERYTGPWAEFNVSFPSGKEVIIEVTYLVDGEGEYPFIALQYIFETGAGWNGTIGSADLIVRLPYEINRMNVIFDTEMGWSTTTAGGIVEGKDIRWHFDDFEPEASNNFSISLVMPSVWRALLREQDNLAQNPQDGEAWGRLGKLYKECFFLRRGFRGDGGGHELYQVSQEAYQKAVTLLPNDALWQAGFADLFWIHWYYSESFSDRPDYTEMIRALQLLQRSLEIDPANEKAITLLDDIRYSVPEAVKEENGQYILLLLTATPTAAPTLTNTPLPPTDTLAPTNTHEPTLQATLTPKPVKPTATKIEPIPTITTTPTKSASKPGLPVCGAAILVPFVLTLWKTKRRT